MERRLGSTALGGRLRTVAAEEICFDLGSGSIGPGGGGGRGRVMLKNALG